LATHIELVKTKVIVFVHKSPIGLESVI
jgi:hypothetical protein